MRDQRLDRLADVLVRYSTRVAKGDLVCIKSDPLAMPLIEALYEAVLKAGGHPFWSVSSERLADIYFEHADDQQLRYLSPIDTHRTESVDVHFSIWAEWNTRALTRVDARRVARSKQTQAPILERFITRASEGSLRWCGTLFPTEASAQDAGMSLRQYESFVFGAGLLDLPDPVGAWRAMHDRQERAREFLQKLRQLRFRVPPGPDDDGTDLTVDVDGATWINCAGTENFPDGELFAGPQGVDGHVNYTFPAVYNGREVTGVRLQFRDGRVVDASARTGEAFLISMLDLDEGARNLGEIAIGTNYQIRECTRNTLFDEKVGGTFHAAVGAGYPESGNRNQSGLHWDMVCELRPDEKTGRPGGVIEGDGNVFHRDGRFIDPEMPGNA